MLALSSSRLSTVPPTPSWPKALATTDRCLTTSLCEWSTQPWLGTSLKRHWTLTRSNLNSGTQSFLISIPRSIWKSKTKTEKSFKYPGSPTRGWGSWARRGGSMTKFMTSKGGVSKDFQLRSINGIGRGNKLLEVPITQMPKVFKN